MKRTSRWRTTRREFLRTVAGTAVGVPLVIPATALGAEGRPPPSERIVMGHIGMGWFGTNDLKIFLQGEDVQNVATNLEIPDGFEMTEE